MPVAKRKKPAKSGKTYGKPKSVWKTMSPTLKKQAKSSYIKLEKERASAAAKKAKEAAKKKKALAKMKKAEGKAAKAKEPKSRGAVRGTRVKTKTKTKTKPKAKKKGKLTMERLKREGGLKEQKKETGSHARPDFMKRKNNPDSKYMMSIYRAERAKAKKAAKKATKKVRRR